MYISSKTPLTPSPKTLSDILRKVAEEIYKYKPYPTNADFSDVAEALIKKHPYLYEPGSYNGCYGWKQRLKTKMGNYGTQLKGIGCAELLPNSLKSKAPEDALPAKKVKRPRRGESTTYLTFQLERPQIIWKMEETVIFDKSEEAKQS